MDQTGGWGTGSKEVWLFYRNIDSVRIQHMLIQGMKSILKRHVFLTHSKSICLWGNHNVVLKDFFLTDKVLNRESRLDVKIYFKNSNIELFDQMENISCNVPKM